MAWFLKLAIDNHWIGPAGRVIIGLIAGAALIAWSERFRRRGFAAFSYSLKALGSGILYLSLWAAYGLFALISSSTAFGAMIVVTAFNGYMCWVQNSELLALYAIVGGFSTPLLLSNGENHEVTLFSYLLLLNVAVLVLRASALVEAAFRSIHWNRTFLSWMVDPFLFRRCSLSEQHSFCRSSFLSLRLRLDWCACRIARSLYRVRMALQWLGYLC